jgi:hypothetical protein
MAPWLAVATACFGASMGQFDASVATPRVGGWSDRYGRKLRQTAL